MRTMVAAIVGCCLLLVAACTKQPVEPPQTSNYIHAKSVAEFHTVASYSTLGDLWSAAGGASAVKNIYTDSEGHRALFELGGQGNTALWLDFSQGRQLQELKLEWPLLGVDMDQQRAFLKDAQAGYPETLLSSKLPSLQLNEAWDSPQTDAPISLIATHPLAKQWWFMVTLPETTTGDGESRSAVVLCKVDDTAAGSRTSITVENISPDCQVVCLADGSLVINSAGFIFLATDTGSQPRRIFSIPSGRQAKVYADNTLGNLCWVFLKPRSGGGGTGRIGTKATPGKLICIDQQGQEQASIETGSVPFGGVAGDWTRRRCLLLQDSVGIALADLQEGTLTWPLRVRDDIMLFLLPNAGEVWAMLPDAIVGIGLDGLVELGSKLAADKVVEGELTDELRPAVAALGWKWQEVQVSPLMSQTGKLTLFDTSDPDSTWSQLDWSTSKHRSTGLLVARVPTVVDLGILEMSESGIEAWCRANLWALGWPQAQLVDSNLDKYEAHFTYSLVPNAKPPLTSGEFQVWITETAAFYSLEGATFEFPSDSLSSSEARSIAVETIAGAAGINAAGLLVSNLPQAGWLMKENSGWRFLHDAQEGATPCFRLEALRDGKSSGLFIVYLDALNGEVLYQVEDRFSPLANLGVVGGKYSKVEADE